MGIADLRRSQLHQLSSFDLTSLTVALGITLLVAVGSAFLPAHDAAQTNPIDTILGE
jgi:ABC-type lipoprotein release transport system permease subunit